MSFSIITASYNSVEYIESCLNSLRSQKSVKFEHIVIDGASSDGTKEILVAQNDIRFVSEKDDGIYHALNKGLALAKNDIIGILHTDDFFVDEFVLKDIKELFDEGADIVYADLEYVSRLQPEKVIRKWKSGVFDARDLEFGWMPPHPTFFAKQEVFEKIGNYRQDFKISADYDLVLRAIGLREFQVQYLPRTIVKMRVGGMSNRSIGNLILKMREDYSIASKFFRFPLGTILSKNLRKLIQFS